MNEQKLTLALNGLGVFDFQYFDKVSSTNDMALDWIASSPQEYAAVMADAQTAGRGRQNRRWVTTPGASIALSIIVYPSSVEQEELGLFPLAAGLAVAHAVENQGIKTVQLKWPNDVLIMQMKTAGILVETVWDGASLKGLVVGIGINVLADAVPPSDSLLFPATCIQSHADQEPDQITLIADTIANLQRIRKDLTSPDFVQRYTSKLAFRGQKVSIRESDAQITTGEIAGIDPSGQLCLRLDDGRIQTFPAGDVSLRPL